MTCDTTPKCTILQAWGSGPSRCEAPDGPMTGPAGLSASLASLSARQAKEAGLLTSGTYDPQPIISSASAALQSALASKLQARTASVGSILYKLTWKERVTPSGRSIHALRATAWSGKPAKQANGYVGPFTIAVIPGSRPNLAILPISLAETLAKAATISANGSASSLSGWTTPQAHDTSGRSKGQKEIHGTKHGCACLVLDAQLTGWPTPVTGNAMGSQSFEGLSATGKTPDGRKVAVALPHVAAMAGWVTTTTRDWKDSGTDIKPRADGTDRFDQLPRQANLAGWPTPTALERNASLETHQKRREFRKHNANQNTTPMYLNEAAQIVTDDAICEAMGYQVAPCGPVRATATGDLLTGSSAGMESGGQLDPAHSRWLQMLPPEWDVYAPTGTPWTRKPRSSSSKRTSPSKATVFD